MSIDQASRSVFQHQCLRLMWLTYLTVACVLIALLLSVVLPVARGLIPDVGRWLPAETVRWLPALCYLVGLVQVAHAMRQLGQGRPLKSTVAATLRRVGLAIGLGGIASVFVVTNLLRLLLGTRGGYLHFDVGGMALALIGGALVLLGHVIRQAAAAQAELDEIL